MAAQTVQVDYTVWTCMSYPQSQVCRLFWQLGSRLMLHHSYISEAAASLLDERLNLHIVPRTQLVSLSSPVCTHAISSQAYAQSFYRRSSTTGSIVKRLRKGSHSPRRSGVCNTSCTASLVRPCLAMLANMYSHPTCRLFRLPSETSLAGARYFRHLRRLEPPERELVEEVHDDYENCVW